MGVHMSSHNLAEVFRSTRESLHQAGLENEFFLDLIASRLVVERVGESTNLEWWDSRVLSETGRARLDEVTPKTQLQSRINLAMKVGGKAESDAIPADSISLFSFGPRIETQLVSAVEDLDSDLDSSLDRLEAVSLQPLDAGWTDAIIEQTASNVDVASVSVPDPSGEAYQLSEEGYEQSEIDSQKWRLLTSLLSGYGQNTTTLRVPYYQLNAGITSESA